MSIYVSGSVAFDRIMTFPGKFEDHILPEKLHILNVSFIIEHMEEKMGGTAGNIAYNMALLDEKPVVYSSVGKDFTPYAQRLENMGLPLHGLQRMEDKFTAFCTITTDKKGNQITGFCPAAMSVACTRMPETKPGDLGCVSPGNVADMCAFPAYYRKTGTPFIFDPGQQVIAMSKEQLTEALAGTLLLVGNDYEIAIIAKTTGLSEKELKQKVGYIITTLGDQGSTVDSKQWAEPVHIPTFSNLNVLDPTGGGDAYRAGLLKALHKNLDMVLAARLGTVCASYCIEKFGTQEHSFTRAEFVQRYESLFGKMPAEVFA